MNEHYQISNTTLTILTITTIIITVGAFTLVLDRLGVEGNIITGFASTNVTFGKVNVTISQLAAITLTTNLVDFNNGTLVGGAAGTYINTSNGTNPGGFKDASPFVVRNDGNVDVNVTINGTAAATLFNSASQYQFNSGGGSESGCSDANSTPALTNINASRLLACRNLSYADSQDTINVHIYLNLSPSLSPTLYQDTAVEFFATSIAA